MSTVYVVQEQLRKNPETGELENRFSGIEKAEKFGEIKFILPPDATPSHNLEVHEALIESVLANYDETDYLIPVGHPIFIGMAVHYAKKFGDNVKFLMWLKSVGQYQQVSWW